MVDAAYLCVFAWRLAACGDELPLVRGLRLGRSTPFWSATLFVFLRGRGNCRSGDALRHPHDRPAAGRGCLGRGLRRHGGGGAFRVSTGAPLGESLGFAERAGEGMAYRQPALPLREILSNRSAISFLFFWFLANFLFGAIPVSLGVTDATVAWEAHIGGFLIGLLAFRWFDPPAAPVAIPR